MRRPRASPLKQGLLSLLALTLALFRIDVDRLLLCTAAGVHADLARLDCLGLRDLQPQNTVVQARLDLVRLYLCRQADRPRHSPVAPLDPVIVRLLTCGL